MVKFLVDIFRDYLLHKNKFDDIFKQSMLLTNLYSDIENIISKYIKNEFDCDDIDIWFIRKCDHNNFITQLSQLYDIEKLDNEIRNKYYLVPVDIYEIGNIKNSYDEYGIDEQLKKLYIRIDVCVSDMFPVNDFSINSLSFDGENFKVEEIMNKTSKLSMSYGKDIIYFTVNNGNIETYTRPLKFSLATILEHIKNKKLVLLYDYMGIDEYIEYYREYNLYRIIQKKRYLKFIDRGYKLANYISEE